MKKLHLSLVLLLSATAVFAADPTIDGKVVAGEYQSTQTALGGVMTISYQGDGSGGVFFAVATKTTGWSGLGLGSKKMDGALILMGLVSDGVAVFSEQTGKGHRHTAVTAKGVSKSAVLQANGVTVMEFHLPAAKVPAQGKSLPFIAAYSKSADLVSFHDRYDVGTFTLP